MLLAAGGSAALLAGAFVFQAMGYAPCKMCIWQRWPHAVALAFGLVALLAPARLLALGGGLAALTTSGIGAYHAGVEYGWWPGPDSCTGSGEGLAGLSGADLLSFETTERIVMCDEVAWALGGISMAGWNAIFSLLLAIMWAVALRRGFGGPAQGAGGIA